MPKILQHLYTPQNPRSVEKDLEQIANVVNGKLSFGDGNHLLADNIDGKWFTVTTPAIAADFTINHNLGRPVSGYIPCQKSGACDIYTSPTANPNPNRQFILRASAVGVVVTLFVF